MIKLNKLMALGATYSNHASSENEKESSYTRGRNMIMKSLNCDNWIASYVFGFIAEGEVWFPKKSKGSYEELEIIKNYISKIGLKYNIKDYGYGGTSIVKL